MDEPTNKHDRGGFEIKNWQIMLALAIQLTLAGIAYGRLIQGDADLERRVTTIEGNKLVSQEEFNYWRDDFRRTLTRIEGEILKRNIDELSTQ